MAASIIASSGLPPPGLHRDGITQVVAYLGPVLDEFSRTRLQRAIQTDRACRGSAAKVRDRGKVGAAEKIRFTSSMLPKWARRTQSLDVLLPILYLRGISTGDSQEALSALLGKDASNL